MSQPKIPASGARLNRQRRVKTFSGGRTIVQELNYANNQTSNGAWLSGAQTHRRRPSPAAIYPIRQFAQVVISV